MPSPDIEKVARAARSLANEIDQSGITDQHYYLADQFRQFANLLDPQLYDPYDD